MIWVILFFSFVSAVLYRMGGSGNYPRWMRVVLIPLLVALLSYFLTKSLWAILTIPLCIGAISTYLDEAPWNNGVDSFWQHGLLIGLSSLPLLESVPWWLILARAGILALFMGIWCRLWKWDIAEETGRGFSIVASLLIFLLK